MAVRPQAVAPRGRSARPALALSLQFGRDDVARAHRDVLKRSRVAHWVRAALDTPGEITVRIVGEDEGRALNREYRQKDYATNVLTFDYSGAPVVTADLVLCAPVVEREAAEQGIGLDAHYAHLLVHGTLHAQGRDHLGDAEAEAMEAEESRIVCALGFADPYAEGGSAPDDAPAA